MTSRPPVLTPRGRAFALFGLIGACLGALLGFPDVTRVGALAGVLPLLAHLLARRSAPEIAVRRVVSPSRLALGDTGRVRVDLTNVAEKRTPLYLAEERVSYALGDRPRFVLTPMGSRGHRRVEYTIRSHMRGRHSLGPVSLRARDPFGMAHVQMILNAVDEVIVLPRVQPLVGLPRGQGKGNEGEIPFMIAAQGEDDVTVRQYRDGDDLRHVHWPATAHRGELMVRQEDRPARRRAVLLLDPRAEAHSGGGSGSTFEWAVSALASIGTHLRHQGYAVHLVAGDSDELSTVEDDLLGRLAVVTPERGTAAAATAVREAHALTAGGAVLIAALVSFDEEYVRQVAQLREPGTSAVAFVAPGPGGQDGPGSAAELLVTSGWRVIRVNPSTPISDAWLAASTTGSSGAAHREGAAHVAT